MQERFTGPEEKESQFASRHPPPGEALISPLLAGLSIELDQIFG
jgi:hypothetical protein